MPRIMKLHQVKTVLLNPWEPAGLKGVCVVSGPWHSSSMSVHLVGLHLFGDTLTFSGLLSRLQAAFEVTWTHE